MSLYITINNGLLLCQPNNGSSDRISGKPLRCGLGVVLLLGGVPAPTVITAGQAVHAVGVCP